MAGGVCAACGGVIPPMELDVATGRGRCPDCDREGTYLRPPAPIAPAPPRPSALLWVIRRAEARAPVDDGPFRRAGAARPETVVEVRAVDADDPRAAVTVTATAVHGLTSVARADVTGFACAAAPDGQWDLVVVAGARAALARGTPPSIVALAELLSAELGLPWRGTAQAVAAPIVPGLARRDDGALTLVPRRRRRSLQALVDDVLASGLILDRSRLRWSEGPAAIAVPTIERFVARGDQLAVVVDQRARPMWQDLCDARAIATALNLELDRLRAPARR